MINATSHIMSEDKSESKRIFQRNLSKALFLHEDWAKDTPLVICKYLTEVHNVQVPQDFIQQITDAHNRFHASEKKISFSLNLVDVIYSACAMWREYLENPEEVFDQLVCQEILSMVCIKTSVLAGRNFAEKQGLPLKKQPPFLFTTIVTEHGALRVYS